MTKWLTDEEQQVWRLWLEVIQRQLIDLEDDLDEHSNLTMSDYEILVTLSESPSSEARMSELAERAIISRSRLTYRVDRLVERGLVTREDAGGDRRGVLARLTPAGMRHLEEAAPHHVAKVQELLFEQLTAEDLAALRCILDKLTGPLRGSG
jgi:DNA-binding MarR family transcriptional regulator